MVFLRRSDNDNPSSPDVDTTTRACNGLLAVTVAVSAGIHLGLAPEHLSEMPRLGVAFVATSMLGVAIAAALMWRPGDRRISVIGGLFCLGQIVAWSLFVTIRVPFFPGTPEAVESIALVCKAVEVVGVGLAAGLVGSWEVASRAACRARTDVEA